MKSSLRLAGAAALCAALLLTACAKKTDQTTTSTDATQSAASPAADAAASPGAAASPDSGATPVAEVTASSAPDATATATATPGAMTVTTSSGSKGAGSNGYITLPVYPGAAETKDGEMSMSTNTGSLEMKVYTTKDDTKKVAEWYKSHLPGSFKGGILTSGDKTIGTFADEHADGDQSVIVANQDGTTRIQLATKHGK